MDLIVCALFAVVVLVATILSGIAGALVGASSPARSMWMRSSRS